MTKKILLIILSVFLGWLPLWAADACRVTGDQINRTFPKLEDALAYANNHPNDSLTLLLLEDQTLGAGYHTLPAKATLVVPMRDGQTAATGTSPERTRDYITPFAFRTLTMAAGTSLSVQGRIELSCQQLVNPQNDICMPSGAYGHILMQAGSHITMENGSELLAWGYVTGAGTIDARRGAHVHEFFQLMDWKGGQIASKMLNNKEKVFPINQYFIQNVEVPVTYRPGSRLIGSMSVYVSGAIIVCDNIAIIGTSDAMFLLDEEDDSHDTWVRKQYDPVRDRQVYDVNSSAMLGSLTLAISGYELVSSKYVLPITNNMSIHLLSGYMGITQNTALFPGSEIEVDKESLVDIAYNRSLYFYDDNDWQKYINCKSYGTQVRYSPSWTNGCPRSVKTAADLGDAKLLVHGTFDVRGGLYTTKTGANICSTNEDAGTIQFSVAATTGTSSVYQTLHYNSSTLFGSTVQHEPTYAEDKCPSALLRNGDGSTTATAGAAVGASFCYIDGRWRKMETVDCFEYDALGNTYYIKPRDYVQLESDMEDEDHLYWSADHTRCFITDYTNCQSWEVTPVPGPEALYYYCADNGRYYYYYEDNDPETPDGWMVKHFYVTWQNWDGTTLTDLNGNPTVYEVAYGSLPQYLGATPTREMDEYYTYDFTGWTPAFAPVTDNVVYTATYDRKEVRYTISFEDASGALIETHYLPTGAMPACENEPLIPGMYLTWTPPLATVTGNQTYRASYLTNPKSDCTITFKNYDGSVLQTLEHVARGTMPVYTGSEPQKPSLHDVDFIFSGWSPKLAAAAGDAVYTATYDIAPHAYTITFVDENGLILQQDEWGYGEIPQFTGIAPTKDHPNPTQYYYELVWSPRVAAVTGNQTYKATFVELLNTLKLTVLSAGHGSISVVQGATDTLANGAQHYAGTFDYGTSLTLLATPDEEYTFIRWSDGNKQRKRTITVDRPITYTAYFAHKQAGEKFEVTDWSEESITINMHNYTSPSAGDNWLVQVGDDNRRYVKANVEKDGTLILPVSGMNADDELLIKGLGLNDVAESAYYYRWPHLFSEDATLNKVEESSCVVVKSGKLTIKNSATIEQLIVYPGAEVVTSGTAQLTCQRILLRTTPSKAASINGSFVAEEIAYTRPTGCKSEHSEGAFYPIALPYTVSISDVTPEDASFREYNGGEAAVNTLEATVGYEMQAADGFYREYIFPMGDLREDESFDDLGKQGAAWQAVCSPLMSLYEQDFTDPSEAVKIAEKRADGSWWQHIPDTIQPTVVFQYENPAQHKEAGDISTQWIHLRLSDMQAVTDETSVFLHPAKFTSDYEAGYDAGKLTTEATRPLLYTHTPAQDLAFCAVPDSLANNLELWAVVSEPGWYTLSLLKNEYLDRMDHVYVQDNSSSSFRTDLLSTKSYAFSVSDPTQPRKFILQLHSRVPSTNEDSKTYKLLSLQSLQLTIVGLEEETDIFLYDPMGHLMDSRHAAGTVNMSVPNTGVYFVRIGEDVEKIILR